MALKTKLANCFPHSWNKFLIHRPSLMQWIDGLQGAGPWLGKSLMSSMDWPFSVLFTGHVTPMPTCLLPVTAMWSHISFHTQATMTLGSHPPAYQGSPSTNIPEQSLNLPASVLTASPGGWKLRPVVSAWLLPTASQPCRLQEPPLGVVLAPCQDYPLLLGPCPPWQGPVSFSIWGHTGLRSCLVTW